jgi:hypothetical protein
MKNLLPPFKNCLVDDKNGRRPRHSKWNQYASDAARASIPHYLDSIMLPDIKKVYKEEHDKNAAPPNKRHMDTTVPYGDNSNPSPLCFAERGFREPPRINAENQIREKKAAADLNERNLRNSCYVWTQNNLAADIDLFVQKDRQMSSEFVDKFGGVILRTVAGGKKGISPEQSQIFNVFISTCIRGMIQVTGNQQQNDFEFDTGPIGLEIETSSARLICSKVVPESQAAENYGLKTLEAAHVVAVNRARVVTLNEFTNALALARTSGKVTLTMQVFRGKKGRNYALKEHELLKRNLKLKSTFSSLLKSGIDEEHQYGMELPPPRERDDDDEQGEGADTGDENNVSAYGNNSPNNQGRDESNSNPNSPSKNKSVKFRSGKNRARKSATPDGAASPNPAGSSGKEGSKSARGKSKKYKSSKKGVRQYQSDSDEDEEDREAATEEDSDDSDDDDYNNTRRRRRGNRNIPSRTSSRSSNNSEEAKDEYDEEGITSNRTSTRTSSKQNTGRSVKLSARSSSTDENTNSIETDRSNPKISSKAAASPKFVSSKSPTKSPTASVGFVSSKMMAMSTKSVGGNNGNAPAEVPMIGSAASRKARQSQKSKKLASILASAKQRIEEKEGLKSTRIRTGSSAVPSPAPSSPSTRPTSAAGGSSKYSLDKVGVMAAFTSAKDNNTANTSPAADGSRTPITDRKSNLSSPTGDIVRKDVKVSFSADEESGGMLAGVKVIRATNSTSGRYDTNRFDVFDSDHSEDESKARTPEPPEPISEPEPEPVKADDDDDYDDDDDENEWDYATALEHAETAKFYRTVMFPPQMAKSDGWGHPGSYIQFSNLSKYWDMQVILHPKTINVNLVG